MSNNVIPTDAARLLHDYGARVDTAIFAAKLDIRGFAASFRHCEQLADYTAQFATSRHHTPDQLNSMLSMCLNEALEMAYRYHGTDGALWLELRQAANNKQSSSSTVALVGIPVDEQALTAYEWIQTQLKRPDLTSYYRDLAANGFEASRYRTSLLELVLLYDLELMLYTDIEKQRALIVMIL